MLSHNIVNISIAPPRAIIFFSFALHLSSSHLGHTALFYSIIYRLKLHTQPLLLNMTTPRPSELINPTQQRADTFTHFSKLPPELRQQMWELSLCHERLVRVSLLSRRRSRDTRNEDPNPCAAVLLNEHEISKLFRVCHESRQAAQRFYRVQVPCYYINRHREPAPGTFYFHPELDTLHIGGYRCCLVDFASFADTLWRHDPKRVGLINIALTSIHDCSHSHHLAFRPRGQQSKEFLRPALARLRRVIFGYTEDINRDFPRFGRYAGQHSFGRQHQISRFYPRLASVSKFDRLPLDPRDIDMELKRVYIGVGNPRIQIYSWFKCLSEWNITYQQPVDYRFMIAFRETRGRWDRTASNRDEALHSLQEEEHEWELYQQACAKEGVPCENDEPALPSAFGFWLFPIDAFGTIPSPTEEESKDSTAFFKSLIQSEDRHLDREWDLSERRPELCLQHLPAGASSGLDESRALEDTVMSL